MADSSNETNEAPIYFYETHSCEDSPVLTVAVERCPLCKRSSRPFYCKSCVVAGCFRYSSTSEIKRGRNEDYEHKKLKWNKKKNIRSELFTKVSSTVQAREKKHAKTIEIEECKRRILLLKEAITSVKKEQAKALVCLTKSKEKIAQRKTKGVLHADKVNKIQEYIRKRRQCKDGQIEEREKLMAVLQTNRVTHVQVLIKYIFPIVETHHHSQADTSMINTIKEACQTAYVRGKWQYTDLKNDALYKILEPTLPANGNFSAYNLWVSVSKENCATPDPECGNNNPGHTFRAALCYSTQLLSILLHILDINCPRRLCYSEFCSDELSEKQLNNAVNKLNHNILYLCFSQGLRAELMSAKDTLHNLYVLVNNQSIGRSIPFEVCEEMVQSVTDGSMSDSEEEPDNLLDEADIGLDWEVPIDFPEVHTRVSCTASTFSTNYFTQAGGNEGGGLISSLWQAAKSTFERR